VNIQTVREALAAQIRGNVDRPTTVYAYPPESPSFPAIVVRPAADYIGYWETFDGGSSGQLVRLSFEVDVAVVAADDQSASIALDAYLSTGDANTSSLFDAIYTDKTLGSTVLTSIVREAGNVRRIADESATVVLMATARVDCYLRHNA